MQRYLLIDGNNITHAASATKPLSVGNVPVQGIFHFLNMLHTALYRNGSAIPVVLWDGASWRHMSFPEYKDNRNKNETKAEKKAQEDRAIAKAQIPAIKKGLQLLGVAQVRASNMEADDLAAIVGDRYVAQGHRVTLMSGDKDWVQLVKPGMIWFDPIKNRKIVKAEDIETALGYKVKDFRQFLEMKCIMGDSGDNIGGVGGIGDKGAMQFLEQYGSVSNFSAGVMDKSIALNSVPKKFRDFAESEEKQMIFQRNLRLMDLRYKQRPEPINLQVDRGSASRDTFDKFCQRLLFQKIRKDLDNWLSVFPAFRPTEEELAAA